jgi:hypothetical protein
MSLVELICHVDDFCKRFVPSWEKRLLESGCKHRNRSSQLCLSEIMTIAIHFHQSHYRTFKAYYQEYVVKHLASEFPHLVSYPRFVALLPRVFGPLCAYLLSLYGKCTGISFIDSTALAVCHNRSIAQHKVFAAYATRGKTTLGWFYGFKLHLVVNERGQLLAIQLTAGHIDDRKPVPTLTKHLFGKLFGDRGYLSHALFEQLRKIQQVQLITKLRKNMKNRLMALTDKLLLRKRALIESIIDQLKTSRKLSTRVIAVPSTFLLLCLPG